MNQPERVCAVCIVLFTSKPFHTGTMSAAVTITVVSKGLEGVERPPGDPVVQELLLDAGVLAEAALRLPVLK